MIALGTLRCVITKALIYFYKEHAKRRFLVSTDYVRLIIILLFGRFIIVPPSVVKQD